MRNPHWVDPGPTPRCPAKTTGDETVTGTCDSGYGHGRSPNQSPSEGEGSRGQRSKHHPRLASTLAMLSITAQSSRQTTLIPSLCPLPRGGVGDRVKGSTKVGIPVFPPTKVVDTPPYLDANQKSESQLMLLIGMTRYRQPSLLSGRSTTGLVVVVISMATWSAPAAFTLCSASHR